MKRLEEEMVKIVDIKKRDAGYCNLKLLLLFLVIYGHMLEDRMNSYPAFLQIYRIIYSVHMPLFIFLSGLFVESRSSCVKQGAKMFLLYVFCQFSIVTAGKIFGWNYSLFTPYWHTWYLLSLACMTGIGCLWYPLIQNVPQMDQPWVKCVIVALAISAACAAGIDPHIGRFLSLSRTICFLPYFLMGMFLSKNTVWKRGKLLGIAALCVYIVLFLTKGQGVPVRFLYQADSFASYKWVAQAGILRGCATRLLCYALGITLGYFILVFIPKPRLPFTKMGCCTLEIYLLHAPLVKLYSRIPKPDVIWLVTTPLISIYIIFLLYKAFQWYHPLYTVNYRGIKETA